MANEFAAAGTGVVDKLSARAITIVAGANPLPANHMLALSYGSNVKELVTLGLLGYLRRLLTLMLKFN